MPESKMTCSNVAKAQKIINETKVCDFNHVLLYAKGHYKQDNIIDDLKKIYAERSAINPECISLSNVCELSLNALKKYAPNKVSHVIEDLFKNSICLFYDKKEYSNEFYLTKILQSILSKLRYIQVIKNEKIILNLGEPDKNILPLVDHKEEEKNISYPKNISYGEEVPKVIKLDKHAMIHYNSEEVPKMIKLDKHEII